MIQDDGVSRPRSRYWRQAENSQFNRHLRVARPFISPLGFRSAFSRTWWILYKWLQARSLERANQGPPPFVVRQGDRPGERDPELEQELGGAALPAQEA